MSKFLQINPKKQSQKSVLPVALTEKEAAEIASISKRTGISKQELIRQMVDFCLDEMSEVAEIKRKPGRPPSKTPSQELHAA